MMTLVSIFLVVLGSRGNSASGFRGKDSDGHSGREFELCL
jgi:hypothetical protein